MKEKVCESVPARREQVAGGADVVVSERVGHPGGREGVHAENHSGVFEGPEHLVVVTATGQHRVAQLVGILSLGVDGSDETHPMSELLGPEDLLRGGHRVLHR